MYNPNFFNPYQPYQNAINNPYQFNSPRVPGYSGQVIQVNGRAGAEALQMEPNSSMVLFDMDSDIMYLKSTDSAGYPTLRVFDFIERAEASEDESKYATKADLHAAIDKITEMVKGEGDGKQFVRAEIL